MSSSSSASSSSKPSKGWQPPTLEEMQAMLPQYQFMSLLGRGGMGAVYKAVQISLDRVVAIKVLPGDLIDDTDAQFAERFKNEARTMAKMNHPAIVNLWDFGETQTGLLFIVMEFIDGTDVSQMIRSQGKLPEDYALSITAHVCDALQYAHDHGVIHRDIKPANILINQEGAVKVADFGLAKQSDTGLSGLTKTNMAMGTPDFVAPEALSPGTVVDGRADLYAVGVMLFQMLTGEIPRGMWTLPGTRLGTDPRFDAIINKAMQTDRELRYQSAAEIRQELHMITVTPLALLQQQATAAAEASATSALTQGMPTQKPTGQRPMTQGPRRPQPAPPSAQVSMRQKSGNGLFYGIVAVVVVVLGLVVMFSGGKKPESRPEVQPVVMTPDTPPEPSRPRKEPKNAPTDSKPSVPTVPAAGTQPARGAGAASVNLLALVDAKRDAVAGEWEMTPEGLRAQQVPQGPELLEFQHTPPEEYDFEIEFTVISGQMEASQVLPVKGASLLWKMGFAGHDPAPFGFGPVLDGVGTATPERKEAMAVMPRLTPNVRHRCLVEVRKESLRAVLDGKEVVKWSGDLTRFSGESFFQLDDPSHLGVASWNTEIVFHKAEVRKPGAPSAVATVSTLSKEKPKPPEHEPVAAPDSAGEAMDLATRRKTLAAPLPRGGVNALAAVTELDAGETFVWERTPEGVAVKFLTNPGPYKSCLALPVELSSDYAAEVWFSIPKAGEDVGLTIPVGDGRQTTCWIWSGDGGWAGFGKVDGHDPQIPQIEKGCTSQFQLQAGELTHLRAEVLRTPENVDIRFSLNGILMAHYNGPTGRLSTSTAWKLEPKSDLLQIGARQATFHRVTVQEVDREAGERARIIAGDPQLKKLDEGFRSRHESDAQKPFESGLATLKRSYVENGIARARAKAVAGGRSEEIAALDAEKLLIESARDLPAEDSADTPDSLKTLRRTYRDALAKLETERRKSAAALYKLYLTALDAYIVELTKAGSIPKAEAAHTLRESLAKVAEREADLAP